MASDGSASAIKLLTDSPILYGEKVCWLKLETGNCEAFFNRRFKRMGVFVQGDYAVGRWENRGHVPHNANED